ncbi:MAG: lysylphosphatidylglycerol synthase domain-containing protein [Pirellulaceae bacterium]|nr:lysylphosphatidylglycerol synthase domain-containing protein [Pirellulaceae bacterium]
MNINKAPWLRTVKWTVVLLVITGIFYTIWQGVGQIRNSSVSIQDFQWQWLPIASLFYFFSITICSIYWHIVLLGLGQQPRLRDSLQAFILGQLGKYFPGKALVVIIRTGIIASPKVQPAVAATSVFIETLTYMAVGAGVASILMVFFIDVGGWLILLGCGAILLAGLPIFPPVFRSIIKILRMDRLSPKIARAASNLKTRTAVIGWILLPFSWLLVGLSLWATTQLTGIAAVDIDELPRLTACAAMAIVVGFLSMMPGGLGVRELVLIAILAPIDPAFDSATTLIVAVTLRLIWLLTELVLTIILKGLGFVSKRKSLKTKSGISSQPNPTGTSSDT